MKKLVVMLLCLSAALVCLSAAGAASELVSGDYRYVLLDDGTARITGYDGAQGAIEIPSALDGHAVTAIGDEAFYRCKDLTAVAIPDGVTAIGDEAFYDCWHLTAVAIPDGVTAIGDEAFYGCSELTTVAIPDSVTAIGDLAFACSSLTAIAIPDSVEAVGANPFALCNLLTDIRVSPDHPALCVIDGALFGRADGRLICHPFAFDAAEYAVPEGTRIVGDYAFYEDIGLFGIELPDGVTAVGERAFAGCACLVELNLPDSVTAFGEDVFDACGVLIATVGSDSFARRYCEAHGIACVCADAGDIGQPE